MASTTLSSRQLTATQIKTWGTQFGTRCPDCNTMDSVFREFEETGRVNTKKPEYQWGKRF